jgi:glycosyltransferase involved in cell wall biosynthesis
MRGVSENEFAANLRDCMLSVWMDEKSSFGTYPIESMASGVPVMSKAPNLIPEWITAENGLWIDDTMKLQDYIAEFVQNWLEDNISENLYRTGIETAEKYSNNNKFTENVVTKFEGYNTVRLDLFQEEYNKHVETQNA